MGKSNWVEGMAGVPVLNAQRTVHPKTGLYHAMQAGGAAVD